MLARAAPVAAALVVLIAGVLQLTAWKARHLVSCRVEPRYDPAEPRQGSGLSADADAAWRYGLRLGLRCSACCAGLTAILLVIGVMDVRAMALVTAAMTVERLAPAGVRVAQAIGVVCVGAGLRLMLHATGIA
jgi:predicted metal-binding membrane protein